MARMSIKVTGASKALFGTDAQKRGGGNNFRIRVEEGKVYLKPSSRPNCVQGEAFGNLNGHHVGYFTTIDGVTAGSYSASKAQRGWQLLTADENGSIHFEAAAEDAGVQPAKKRGRKPGTTTAAA